MTVVHPLRTHQSRRPTWGATVLGCASLALFGAMPTAAQEDLADEWKVTPEEVEAARSQVLFETDELLRFTLTADFHAIRREDRKPDAEEREGSVTVVGADGAEATIALKLNTRGNWRLNPRNCQFPPLWLNFRKSDEALLGTPFEGQDRLKLYVPCRITNDRYRQYSVTEYLIYPMFRTLTEAGFQARPVEVTYVDNSGEDDTFTDFAFLLEHKDGLAARNEAVPLDMEQLHPVSAHQESIGLVEIFNYMIGMTDWSAVYFHNIELIRRMDGALVPVPYDFDWSGMVNARYAKPDPRLPIRNVRQRHFQGFCRPDLDYAPIWNRFVEAKADIYAVWQNSPLLDDDARKRAIEYLDDFYEDVENEGRRNRVLRDCQRLN